MSPKLVRTYPHKVENRGITMAPLFLRDNVKTNFNQMNENLIETSILNALSGPAKNSDINSSILVQFESLLAIISVNDSAKKYKKMYSLYI